MKLCFIDTETTGLDAKKNGIIQIGGVIVANDERVEFNIPCNVFPEDEIADAALKANHITHEQIASFQPARKAYVEFTKILDQYIDKFDPFDKLFFIAYNAKFDWDFMWSWFKKNGDSYFGSYFYSPFIDLWSISGWHDMENRHKYKTFKLSDACKIFGVEVNSERQHDAIYDALLVDQLYHKLITMKGV